MRVSDNVYEALNDQLLSMHAKFLDYRTKWPDNVRGDHLRP